MARRPQPTTSTLTDAKGEVWRMTSERKPDSTYGRSFMVVFQDAARALARDADAPPQATRVWAWAIGGGLHFETYRTISQQAVGEELAVSHTTIGRCLAYLRDRGLVERIGAGPRQQWRLTPESGWRGTAGQYQRRRRADATASKAGLSVIDGGRDAE